LTQNTQKKVAETKQRNYAVRIAKFWFKGKQTMPKQAKTLTAQNLKQVLDYVVAHKHALRNRTMLLVTHYAGMRVGEVAYLRYADVIDEQGKIRDEIQLEPAQTKGRHARVVFVNAKLRRELEAFLRSYPMTKPEHRLFYTQKLEGKIYK
jgi:integrase/recombinase XerD